MNVCLLALAGIAVLLGAFGCIHGLRIIDFEIRPITLGLTWLVSGWLLMSIAGYWVVTFFVG